MTNIDTQKKKSDMFLWNCNKTKKNEYPLLKISCIHKPMKSRDENNSEEETRQGRIRKKKKVLLGVGVEWHQCTNLTCIRWVDQKKKLGLDESYRSL